MQYKVTIANGDILQLKKKSRASLRLTGPEEELGRSLVLPTPPVVAAPTEPRWASLQCNVGLTNYSECVNMTK